MIARTEPEPIPKLMCFTILVVFLVIYGPFIVIFVMGGKNCRDAQNSGKNVNMAGNIPVFYSITCNDLDIINKVIGTTGLLQVHTLITIILGTIIFLLIHGFTVCCRSEIFLSIILEMLFYFLIHIIIVFHYYLSTL